jgi:hypothetical protein
MCECVKKTNEVLESKNLQIEEAILVGENSLETRIPIHTEFVSESKKKRGQKAISIMANYCPFCGEKFPSLKSSSQNQETKVEASDGENQSGG